MPRNFNVIAAQPLAARDLAELLYNLDSLYDVAYFTKYNPDRRVWGRISNNSIPKRDLLTIVDLSEGSIVGRLRGATDAIRKTVSWAQRALHIDETREKIRSGAQRDRAEARKLDAEARRIDAETRALDVRTLNEMIQQLRSVGYSDEEIRQLVRQADSAILGLSQARQQGRLLGLTEGDASDHGSSD